MAAEPRRLAGIPLRRMLRKAVGLAIPMAVTLALFYAGDLGLIPSSGPLAWLAACCAALAMATALIGVDTSRPPSRRTGACKAE